VLHERGGSHEDERRFEVANLRGRHGGRKPLYYTVRAGIPEVADGESEGNRQQEKREKGEYGNDTLKMTPFAE